MNIDQESEHDFNPDNRAWRRLLDLLAEHFDVLTWQRAEDSRPVVITLTDIDSGDQLSLGVLDSLEVNDPYVLLAISTGDQLSAHGPFDGEPAAASHAAWLAASDTNLLATRPAPLLPADQARHLDQMWLQIPARFASTVQPADPEIPPVVLVVLDRGQHRLAVIGPFAEQEDAHAWRPRPDGEDLTAERLIVSLRPLPNQL